MNLLTAVFGPKRRVHEDDAVKSDIQKSIERNRNARQRLSEAVRDVIDETLLTLERRPADDREGVPKADH